eukprot:TRINITY_DN6231_c0_g1_i1.p1 TRINITY_DN6231_c0_g1~~TRINITY_DN6231_c0_g1_i1.p1  ORF type:complete len:421 (-),score=94.61 TRINITY_DN6231_c0_g1_i1:112-1374(-)
MVGVVGKALEEQPARAPVDLIAVVDRSASMVDKLQLVKDTLSFMTQQLMSTDRLGLVMYDQDVDVLLPLTPMTTEGKERASYRLQKLTVGGQTNCSGGLFKGLDLIRKRSGGNDVCSILLFTDGVANVGLTKPEQIKRAVHGVLNQLSSPCSIFTFGYGEEPDPAYLREISDEGNGVFYQIENPNDIPLAFSDCLGGLLSVVAQHIVLTIKTPEGIKLLEVQTSFKKVVVSTNVVQIIIEDIYSEEEKDFLCMVMLNASQTVEREDVLEVSISYTNAITKKEESLSEVAFVFRKVDIPPTRVNPVVDKQKNRIICANAMREALTAGETNNYKQAVVELEKAENVIRNSITAADPYCQILVQQLTEGRQEVQSKDIFRKKGQSTLTSYANSHYQQRGTHRNQSYRTTPKSNFSSSYISQTK